MKIVVIGGTGLIGSKVVAKLDRAGPRGRSGLAQARHQHDHRRGGRRSARGRVGRRRRVELAELRVRHGPRVLRDVDPQPAGCGSGGRRRVTTSPYRSSARRSCRRVAISTTTTAGYFLGEARPGGADPGVAAIPYSIVHATQFFEFIKSIADVRDGRRHGPPATGPVPADGGRRTSPRRCAAPPSGRRVNGIVEVGGPEQFRFDEAVRRVLARNERPARGRDRPRAGYFGHHRGRAHARARATGATLGEIRLDDWLRETAAASGGRRAAPLDDEESQR